jgi:hypothetical protein
MVSTEDFLREVGQNIKATVIKLKKEQTTGCSMNCLFQLTPTPKCAYNVAKKGYRAIFEEQAKKIAKDFLID